MWKWRLLFCFFSPLLVLSAAAQPGPQSASSTPATVTPPSAQPLAQVLILALDSTARPAPPPAKDTLNVQFDGKPVEVDEIRSLKDEPLIFSMVVDKSASTLLSAKLQTATAIRLFRALSTGNNHGYLVLFNDDARASDHFVDAEAAEQTLREAVPRGSTALYDAIVAACTQQLRSAALPPAARRAILVFSDGADNTSTHSLRKTVEVAQRERVPIFSIKIRVDTEPPRAQKSELEALKTLSDDTGGLVIVPDEHGDVVGYLLGILANQSLMSVRTAALKPKKSYSLKTAPSANGVSVVAQIKYFTP